LIFRVLETNLTRDVIDSIINKVAEELVWVPHLVKKKVLIFKTYPGFFLEVGVNK